MNSCGLNFYVAVGVGRGQYNTHPYTSGEALGLDMTGDFAAAWLPAIFVPITGIVFPAVFIVLMGRVITAAE